METRVTPGQSRTGMGMARAVKALIQARGDWMHAEQIAAAAWPAEPAIAMVLRAAMNSGSLGNSTWGSQMAAAQTLVAEFISATQAVSVVSRLANVHRVPFHVRIARETLSPTVSWTQESAPKVVSELAYDAITLEPFKAAALVAISDELSRSSAPSAEQLIRNSLVNGVARYIDRQFLDPSVTATSAHPASITSQVTAVSASGTTAAAVAADITSLIDALINGGNSELASPMLIMSPRTAIRIGLKRDTSGGAAYPGLGFNGGQLLNIPVLTTVSAPYSVSGGGGIVLLDQNEIVLADDNEVAIDYSREAAVQMDSAPSAGAQTLTPLWQNNLIGIRAERSISWKTRHAAAAAVAFLDGTQY